MSRREVTKDWALSIGSQLASIEDSVGRIASAAMQAAIHDQSGVLDTAIQESGRLDDQVTALSVDLRKMRHAMRKT